MRPKNRILNFHNRFEFPAMLVVCGWSIWTPPVIRVDTHTRMAVLCLPFPNLRWVSFELIWGVIWAHMRCHLSSYETSFELMWAHLISNNLIWYQITSNDTSYEMSNETKRGSAGVSKNQKLRNIDDIFESLIMLLNNLQSTNFSFQVVLKLGFCSWIEWVWSLKHLRAVHFWILENQELKVPVDSSSEAAFWSPS